MSLRAHSYPLDFYLNAKIHRRVCLKWQDPQAVSRVIHPSFSTGWLTMGLVGTGKKRKMTQGDRGVRNSSMGQRPWTHPMASWAAWNTPGGKAPTDDLRRDRLKDGDEHSVEQEETKLQGKTNKGSQWGTAQAFCVPMATDPKGSLLPQWSTNKKEQGFV